MAEDGGRRISFNEFKSISRALTKYEDLNTLIHHIVRRICHFFEVRACSVLLYDDRQNELFRVSSCGISKEYLNKGPIPLDEKSCRIATAAPVFISDMRTDPRVLYPEAAEKEGLVSMLTVPIKYRNTFHGIIRIYHTSAWSLHEDDLDSFGLVGELMGLVVENFGLKNCIDQVKTAMGSLPKRMLVGL